MTKSLLCLLLVYILSSAAPIRASNDTIAAEPNYRKIARNFAASFPNEHLKYNELDDSISRLAWTNYVDTLDPDHTYFLQSDIEQFKPFQAELDNMLKNGELDFAYEVFNVFKQRVKDRYDYTEKLLNGEFDLTIKESYTIKRQDMPYASSETEWNELWRKKIKNEYVRNVVAKEFRIAADSKTPKPDGENTATNEVVKTPDPLEPRELILKRYKNMMTIISDSDSEWVLQRYLSSLCSAYDPHSAYLSPSALTNFDIEMKLSLTGIGALLQPEDGTAMIVRLIAGGPAFLDTSETRLKPNDKIIAVGQGDEEPVDILHWPLDKVVKLIRGTKGTEVVLKVIPASDPTGATIKTVRLIRDEVKLEDQEAKWSTRNASGSEGPERKIGIITLPAFYANMYVRQKNDPEFKSSAEDVRQLLLKANEDKVDAVLLDLRNNGGGALLEAINMTGLFIKTGPVVQVKERFRRVLDDDNPEVAYSGPLLVLVNRLSASASEILASALQDYGRALIVGDTKTHGKGTVQTILNMGDDSAKLGAIKVTTAGYYRISGESTQLKGVIPDIVLSSPFDHKEWGEENLPNAIQLDPVPKANYLQVGHLEPYIIRLEENSRTRTATNLQFNAYTSLLQRIRTIYDIKEMPLDLESRKEMSQSEKELYELQDKMFDTASGVTNNVETDFVLIEGLNILADMVTLMENDRKPAAVSAPPPAKNLTLMEKVSQWLKTR